MHMLSFFDWAQFPLNLIWIIEVLVLLLLTTISYCLEAYLHRSLQAKFINTKNIWDDALLWSIHKPLQYIIGFISVCYLLEFTNRHLMSIEFIDKLPIIQQIGCVILSTWALIRFSNRIERDLTQHVIDKTTVHAISHLARISILILSMIVIMQILHFDLTALLAFGGAGSIIIGIASKDLLANFFGAFIIYLDKPFKVGDWIRSPDKNIEGVVEYIGWRLTRIRTFDKRPLYVPNAIFATISVENGSRMTHRRLKEVFGVRYKDAAKMPHIINDLKEVLLNHPDIDQHLTIAVNLHELGTSSLNCMYTAFTKNTAWISFQNTKQSILLAILEILKKHSAELAFPTTTIDLNESIREQLA